MKEQTYGWYPSAKNVYEDRRIDTLTPYQLEALYRYRDSKYYQPAVTPQQQRTPKSSRSKSSRSSSKAASQKLENNVNLRVQSAPIHTLYKPPPKLIIPTPQQCWSTHVPETEITFLPPQPYMSASMPRETTPHPATSTKSAVKVVPAVVTLVPETVKMPSTAATQTSINRIARIQSASVLRETPTKPQRPVHSAGPVRPSPSPVRQASSPQTLQTSIPETYIPVTPAYIPPHFEWTWPYPSSAIDIDDIPVPAGIQLTAERPPSGRFSGSRQAPTPVASFRPCFSKRATPSQRTTPSSSKRPPSGKRTPIRPMAPSPSKMELRIEDEYLQRCETPDYDEQLNKYGWMMEVHGDPLKLKKVSRRLPYTVKLDEPETERDPPKVHMENNDTFFLNTIPRRPYEFSIDKEWISEIIHKKRLQMQEKHGMNYRYKNFSFVY